MKDSAVEKIIQREAQRQKEGIELIASENYVSHDVLEAQGSLLTNKYAEGYPAKRYYGGCEFVDEVEMLAIERAKALFGAEHANVQPHSGSQANMAVYMSVLEEGDKVLAMSLDHGGHLTHGYPINFSGALYTFYGYGVTQEEGIIDYEAVRKQAKEIQPKLIVAGASAYAREIDFEKFREIADEVGALLMVDMAHIAGLVAAGLHSNPIPHADFVTTTTHKTLRGPRGGMILCKEKYAKDIDRMVFPGIQGGPLMHVIAAKAVAFLEASTPEYKVYMQRVKESAACMATEFQKRGYEVVSGGTDNHLFMVNVKKTIGISGKKAQEILGRVHITLNKNSIPFDTEKPFITSGIRIGTPAIMSREFTLEDACKVVEYIDRALQNYTNEEELERLAEEVRTFASAFPLPNEQ